MDYCNRIAQVLDSLNTKDLYFSVLIGFQRLTFNLITFENLRIIRQKSRSFLDSDQPIFKTKEIQEIRDEFFQSKKNNDEEYH